MKRRRVVIAIVLLVGTILLALFIAFGLPLIIDTFSTPIPGLPTNSASSSLRDRYTQTALAKQSTVNASETPTPAAK